MIRAVVFDLDDTLIDTTGLLVAPAHREAAAAMIAAGLEASLEEVAEKRIDFAKAAPVEQVDLRVAAFFGAGEEVAAAGHRAYFGRSVAELEPFSFVPAVMEALSERTLLLVTAGFEATQRKKLELAGLVDYFDAAEVVPVGGDKGVVIARLLREREIPVEATVVVGDKVDGEIEAGRRLGAWTVRVAYGEGAAGVPQGPLQRPHYTVPSIEALPAVIEDIEGSGDGPND